MEYKCKCCGAVEWASNVDEMLERKGYCIICDTLGEETRKEVKAKIKREQEQLAKKEYAENHYNEPIDISRKKVKAKHTPKHERIKVFKCVNEECGNIIAYASFDHKCEECGNRVVFVAKMSYKQYLKLKDKK